MPSLNQCEFVEVAVRSVFEQSRGAVELLICDGGSRDGTLGVLEKLVVELGPQLRWMSAADGGPANAINKALQSARGDIIGWLNADDIYAPGAIAVAVGRLSTEPELVMVYGEAEHVDGAGRVVGRYPSRPPSAGIEAFQAGCFICQPTVFLRRRVFDQIGVLNEKLSTAFDFDLWLRVFLHFPGRIGHADRVQAFSRVHGRTITSRERKAVACEAVQLLSRHLGHADPHWILTYIDEVTRAYPAYETTFDLCGHVSAMLTELGSCFEKQALEHLHALVDQDKRLAAMPAGVHADIFPDGWAGQELFVRIRSPLRGPFSLLLRCANSRPVAARLELTIRTNCGTEMFLAVERDAQFEISVPFSNTIPDQLFFVSVQSSSTFIPKYVEQGSTDTRELAFRISQILLVESSGSVRPQ